MTDLHPTDSNDFSPIIYGNLPIQSTTFVGRQRELAEITQLLFWTETRLLTILAPGGMGKTRLALAVAEEHLPHFADGVIFVPLVALSSPEDIAPAIAENIGLQFYSSETPTQQLQDYLHERQLLLILDNFEHLLDGATLLRDIIHNAPQVKLLVTSREKLRLTNEIVFTLSGLNFLDWDTSKDALTYDAVRLFTQTAQRVRPDFDLQSEESDYLARICRLTNGMPLALVLAAGWIDVLTLEQIADEIQQGIDILETELRDIPDRHKNMRVMLNYTWGRLNEDERNVFMTLSIFRGGFTAEALEAVMQVNKRHLRRLVDKALLQALPIGRYDIHELLRQFGEEKLSEVNHSVTIQQKHARYYLNLITSLEPDLQSSKVKQTDTITTEFGNIRRAWWWAVDHQHYETLGKTAKFFMTIKKDGNFTWDIYELFKQTIAVLELKANTEPHPAWDYILLNKEWLYLYLTMGQIDRLAVEDILSRSQQRGNQGEVVLAYEILAKSYRQSGNVKIALEYSQKALQLWQMLGHNASHSMLGLGITLCMLGRLEQARAYFERCFVIRRSSSDLIAVVSPLYQLAQLELLQGNLVQSQSYVDKALAILSTHDTQVSEGSILFLQAFLLLLRGKIGETKTYVTMIDQLGYQTQRHTYHFCAVLLDGLVACIRGDDTMLLRLTKQTRTQHLDIEMLTMYHNGILFSSWFATMMYYALADDKLAKQSLCTLLTRSVEMKSPMLHLLSLPIAAALAARDGNSERAVELLALAYTAPEDLMGWIDHWQPLQEIKNDLKAQFDQDNYSRIWQRGAKLDVEHITRELLGEFGAEIGDSVEQVNASLLNPLTPKELEVLSLLSENLTNPQIAERLFITTGTVKGHVNKVLHKLDVTKRQQAVTRARELSLLKT